MTTAATIRGMAGRATRIFARILFCLCGLASLLTAAPYVLLRGVGLPQQWEWIVFVIALGLVGLISITAAVLPRSWIARLCRKDVADPRIDSLPLKLLGGFALFGYLVALLAHFAPRTWDLNPQIMFPLCPMYLIKENIDPAPALIFFLLAPMNAAVFGALGVTMAIGWLSLNRK